MSFPVSCLRRLVPAVLLLTVCQAPRPALADGCDMASAQRQLRLALQARFWGDFWMEMDDREARVELLRARYRFAQVLKVVADPACDGDADARTLAWRMEASRRQVERILRVVYRQDR